jgi:hypothetical protein
MSNVEGKWNTVIKDPTGDQSAVLTVVPSGDSFTGSYSGTMGDSEVKDGKVNGNALSWKADITVPMPMTIDFIATVDGNAMSGSATSGTFGSFPLTGTRA